MLRNCYNSMLIHLKILQTNTTEIYKTKNGINPKIINKILKFTESFLDPKIFNLLPIKYKDIESLH